MTEPDHAASRTIDLTDPEASPDVRTGDAPVQTNAVHAPAAVARLGAAAAAASGARGGPSLVVLSHSLALFDTLALYFSAWLTLRLAFGTAAADAALTKDLFGIVPLTLAFTFLGFAITGLYSPAMIVRVARHSVTLLAAWAAIGLFTALAGLPLFDGPYSLIIAWLCIAPVCILVARLTVAAVLRVGLAYGKLGERVVLVGTGPDLALASQFIRVDRLVSPLVQVEYDSDETEMTRRLCDVDDVLRKGHVDSAVLMVPSGLGEVPLNQCVQHFGAMAVRVVLLPVPVLQAWSGKDDFDLERAVVVLSNRPISGWGRLLKSSVDKLAALTGLLVFGPLMLLIALAIKLDSPGPVFFKQRRHGLNGRVFKILKFRSMTVCEDGSYIKQAEKNDARVTRVGKFIRSTSFDELPQFLNVLKGDMSVVGPRPHAIAHDELYIPLIPTYRQRFRVKPGITGWAQINGLRGETRTLQEMADRIEYDIDYTRRWWIGLDIWILFKTLFVGFIGARTY